MESEMENIRSLGYFQQHTESTAEQSVIKVHSKGEAGQSRETMAPETPGCGLCSNFLKRSDFIYLF